VKAVRQTAQNATKILRTFYEAHGADVMMAAYGWREPTERMLKRNERFWAYYDRPERPDGAPDDPSLVGWGSLDLNTRDAEDTDAHLVVGVFPAYQRRGYRRAIYEHMVTQAEKLGADQCSIIVKKSNEAQFKRTMREAHEPDSTWVYAGDVWFPAPGYGYFVRPLGK
jgi:GNAT superfamily N-acetyltransferase